MLCSQCRPFTKPSVIEPNVVLILLGSSTTKTSLFRNRCCIINISGEIGIFELFNTIQSIFDKYEEWDKTLHKILKDSSDISELLESSSEIIGNPLGVIDKNFKYIGLTNQESISSYLKTAVSSNQNLDPNMLRRFLNAKELSTMLVREPLLLDIEEYKTMNLNLFDDDTYIGCMTIWNVFREFRPGDTVLADYLREILQQAVKKYSFGNISEKVVINQILKDSIDGLPINYNKMRRIKEIGSNQEYVCAKLEISKHVSNLPIDYICSNVEDTFPKSFAFDHNHSVVTFINTDEVKDSEGRYLDKLKHGMRELAESMDLHVGISDSFTDIFSSRLYYLQADAALSNGKLMNHLERIFEFQEYALDELVINSLGELPIEFFYSDGLRRLIQHDEVSQISYMDTLRVYLNNNMSITKTASDLFLHRSTLIERLNRIKRDIDADLENPDIQLRIRIILKAHEINRQIINKSPS